MKILRTMVLIAVVLAFFVVMLGAYTRLTNAGLGCPDWPGCYGHLVLPSAQPALEQAQELYPDTTIESHKAWTEMIHRYAAGSLALLIFAIGIMFFYRRKQDKQIPWIFPLILVLLVVFQAALGMWTVTLKLLPVVVMGHLLGGILIFACLCYLLLQLRIDQTIKNMSSSIRWRFWINLAIFFTFLQIALGGWVSSNYAGIACIGFPQCNGVWLPALNFLKAFNFFAPIGANYQGGLLDNDVRVTIQFAHRLGAILVAGYVAVLSIVILLRVKHPYWRNIAILAFVLVLMQFTLGIVNVLYLLPLSIAVLHNGVAALLLATMFSLRFLAQGKS